ncbi:MAG: diadenylate cyclase CdaA [Firmicutes bacterium]|nr:diadenylate cyclase CdaA [Bacillota bacterium]MCR4711211.1 diadenylate cyclase CdaA [Clostridia bacterium]
MKQTITEIFASLQPSTILDILVVAYIVYKILGFIRDSRAQQLVKGLLVLGVAYAAADLLQLHLLLWILKGAWTVGIIAIIIIFQPELRRGLERMGRGGLLNGHIGKLDKGNAKRVTDEFVEAIDMFSETRTGALIVIEREVSLGDIAETGTIVDAEVSAEMLGNIFYKGAPLHDGAVIIRDGRIFAAGCVLPLTASLELSKDLGTRHRAAIGITENSDAVTLIVSEENGVISVARGGRLKRFLDTKELEKLLLNLFIDRSDEDKSLMGWVHKILGRKEDAE